MIVISSLRSDAIAVAVAVAIVSVGLTPDLVIGSTQTGKPARLIIMADMGNEPDEEQQMTHLLMYANRVDLEGLAACSGKFLNAARTDGRVNVHPELFHGLVDGYAQIVDNLKKHESGWSTPVYLRSIIKAGTAGYGIEAVKQGLADPEHLCWGGWSGRFSSTRHKNIYSRHEDIRLDEEKYGDFFMFEADSETETWTDPVQGRTSAIITCRSGASVAHVQ